VKHNWTFEFENRKTHKYTSRKGDSTGEFQHRNPVKPDYFQKQTIQMQKPTLNLHRGWEKNCYEKEKYH
jgi:hypothetical protein